MPTFLQTTRNNREKTVLIIAVIFYAVGAVGLSFPATRQLFQSLVPAHLLLVLFLLLTAYRHLSGKFAAWAVIVAGAAFFTEWYGVHSRLLFGTYHYGKTLGPGWDGIPFLIGINWLVLIFCTTHIAQRATPNPWLAVVLAAGLMTGLDLLIEPVAIKLDFWQWDHSSIPLQNYMGWFAVSLVLCLFTQRMRIPLENTLALPLYVLQLLFFAVLNFTLG